MKHFSDFPRHFFFLLDLRLLQVKNKGLLERLWMVGKEREGFSPPEGLIEMIGKYPVPMCVLFRKQCASEASIDLENPMVWDCDFLAQLAGKFPFAISKKHCGIFRYHSQSFTGSNGYAPLLEGFNKFRQRVKSFSFIDDSVKLAVDSILKEDFYQIRISSVKTLIKEKYIPEAKKSHYRFVKRASTQKDAPFFVFYCPNFCTYFRFAYFFLYLIRKTKGKNRKNPWQGHEHYRELLKS